MSLTHVECVLLFSRMDSPTKDKKKEMTEMDMEESTNNDRQDEPSVEITLDTPEVIVADEDQPEENR